MKSTIEETHFFYRHFFQTNLCVRDKKRLIEFAVKHSHLNRFTALLPNNNLENINLQQDVESKFKAIRMAIIATNIKQQAFIRSLTKILEEQSIEIILLKSSALNGYIYTDGLYRGNSDIDILVSPEQRNALEEILGNFARIHHLNNPQPFDGLYENTWISKQDPTLFLDVHTSLTNPKLYAISLADIQQQSLSHPTYKSEAIRMMSPEHNFIHAGLHILGDGYIPHHSLLDAMAIYLKEDLDWGFIEATSNNWGCSLITKLLRTELENTFLIKSSVKKTKTEGGRLKIGRRILSKHYPTKTIRRKIQQALLQITLVDNLLKVMTTQVDYIRLRLFGH